jgi:hypothetical protein
MTAVDKESYWLVMPELCRHFYRVILALICKFKIEIKKPFTLFPGPNVIKLFTTVIY